MLTEKQLCIWLTENLIFPPVHIRMQLKAQKNFGNVGSLAKNA